MRILLTNDDGCYAKGIRFLYEAIQDLAEVTVVAPARNRSGTSCGLTLNQPLQVFTLDNGFISVDGTPADCVHLAFTGMLKHKPDLILSGINHGENLSDDVLYSGTVGAAIEGVNNGVPGFAFSLVNQKCTYFDSAAKAARELVLYHLENPLPKNTLLNVNVPDIPYEQIQGHEITRLGSRYVPEPSLDMSDPRGNTVYWIGLPGHVSDDSPGTDFHAVKSNRISITPINIDMTKYNILSEVQNWLDNKI